MKALLSRIFYRRLMRWAHRHNWHHGSVSTMENGDVQRWCQWCGMREVLKREHFAGFNIATDANCPRNSIVLVNLKNPAWFG